MPSKKKLQKALEKDREIQELQRKLEEDKHWNEGIDERGKKREEKQNKQQAFLFSIFYIAPLFVQFLF